MLCYEYKVIPAPVRGEKARGVKSTGDRFALALTNLMNTLGAEGWEYVRADTLPCEERAGLTGTRTTVQNLLVFRRVIAGAETAWTEPALTRAAPAHVAAPSAPLLAAGPVILGGAAAPAIAAPSVNAPEPVVAPALGAAPRRDFAAE